MSVRRVAAAALTAVLVAAFIAAAHAQATTASQSAKDTDPWPPAGVHLSNEPGLTLPTVVEQVKARYTPAALRARVQGSVTLSAVIETDGSVGPVRVLRSLDQELDAEATAAVKQWRFTPAAFNGTAVRVLVTLDLAFRLNGAPPAAPVLSWPGAFPTASASLPNEDSWRIDVEHADNLEYRIAIPRDWTIFPGAGLANVISADRRVLLHIGEPRPFPRTLDRPLPPAELAALGQALSQSAPSGRRASLTAAGQVRTANGFWLWFELPTTIDAAELARGLAGAPRQYDGLTSWEFAATIGGRLVQVGCSAMRERERSDADFDLDKREAGVVCARIIDRLTITAN